MKNIYIYNSEQKLRYCPSQPHQSAKVARLWLKKEKKKKSVANGRDDSSTNAAEGWI